MARQACASSSSAMAWSLSCGHYPMGVVRRLLSCGGASSWENEPSSQVSLSLSHGVGICSAGLASMCANMPLCWACSAEHLVGLMAVQWIALLVAACLGVFPSTEHCGCLLSSILCRGAKWSINMPVSICRPSAVARHMLHDETCSTPVQLMGLASSSSQDTWALQASSEVLTAWPRAR